MEHTELSWSKNSELWIEAFLFVIVGVAYVLVQNSNNNIVIVTTLFAISLFCILLNKYIIRRDIYNVLLFIFIAAIQNMAIGLGGNINPIITGNNFLFLVAFKELFILVGIGIYGISYIIDYAKGKRKLKLYTFDWVMAGFLCWLFLSFIFIRIDISISIRISYLRNFSVLFGLYIWLRLMKLYSPEDLQVFIHFMVTFAVVICIFGIIEYIFFSDELWIDVFHAQRLHLEKSVSELLPLWDTQIGPLHLNRIVSIFMQPVNLSYFLVLPLVFILMIAKEKKGLQHYIAGIFILVSFILTYSKGGLLILVLSLFLYFAFKIIDDRFFVPLAIGTVIISVVGVTFISNILSSSADIHLQGLIAPIKSLADAPLGHGIGMGGNLAYQAGIISGKEWLATGGESGIGVLCYQLGIPGLLLFAAWFILFAANLFDMSTSAYGRLSSAVIIATLASMLFQENALGPQATGVFIIFAVIMLQQQINPMPKLSSDEDHIIL